MFQIKGKIWFDPKNVTKKHNNQSEWKRMAMVVFDCDMTEYYSWFIRKRYGLRLNRPLRGPHISFINDSIRDMGIYADEWENVKKKYNGKEVTVTLNPDVRSDGKYWWLPVLHKKDLLEIRSELGLGNPYWDIHMTIGYANEKNIEHSEYIHKLVSKYKGSYN